MTYTLVLTAAELNTIGACLQRLPPAQIDLITKLVKVAKETEAAPVASEPTAQDVGELGD